MLVASSFAWGDDKAEEATQAVQVRSETLRTPEGATQVLRVWYRVLPQPSLAEITALMARREAGKEDHPGPDRGHFSSAVLYATLGTPTEVGQIVFAHYLIDVVGTPSQYIATAWAQSSAPTIVVLDGERALPIRRRLSHYVIDPAAKLTTGVLKWGREEAALNTRPIASKPVGRVVLGKIHYSWGDLQALSVPGGTLISMAAGEPMGHVLGRFDIESGTFQRVKLVPDEE